MWSISESDIIEVRERGKVRGQDNAEEKTSQKKRTKHRERTSKWGRISRRAGHEGLVD